MLAAAMVHPHNERLTVLVIDKMGDRVAHAKANLLTGSVRIYSMLRSLATIRVFAVINDLTYLIG